MEDARITACWSLTIEKYLGFEDVDAENVQEFLEPYSRDISDDNLLRIEPQCTCNEVY